MSLTFSLPRAEKASEDMGRFCREMELEADREGLILMARAGYHPDFVPALHHLLHARGTRANIVSLYAMHPCWEERDHELSRAPRRGIPFGPAVFKFDAGRDVALCSEWITTG